MSEIPGDIFSVQKMLSDHARAHIDNLGVIFRPFNAKASIAAVGGLLTVPLLQANAVRLEATAHFLVANAVGKKKPNKQDAARWFKKIGQVFAHMEDAAEDVFVARVHMEGRNYRILEGLAEANGHHLQHILTTVEHMPDRGAYRALKQSCRAMLALSDLVCARAELDAFCQGREYGFSALPVEQLPTVKTLAARVTFSDGDLANAGISRSALSGFCLPITERNVGIGGFGDSALERQPLIDFHDEIVVALPSAMAIAVRRAVIETCLDHDSESALLWGLSMAQTEEISLNPITSCVGIPPVRSKRDSNVLPFELVEFQPGLWFQLILLTDDFTDFHETGFSRPRLADNANVELQQAIDAAASRAKASHGFKLGLSLVVLRGYGRGQLVEFTQPDHWLAEGVSSYDLEVLGWRYDFTIAELLKFLLAEGTAAYLGFPLMAINGLLARVAFAYENNGHVVPHEAMPDGSEGATLMIPTNMHLRLRAEHHMRFDKHAVRDDAGTVVVVSRKDSGRRSPENTQRMYVSLLDVRQSRYRGVWMSGNRSWWIETLPQNVPSNLYPVFEMQMVWMERLAPILERHLPSLPDKLTWKLVTPAWPEIRSDDIKVPPISELKAGIRTSSNHEPHPVVTTEIGASFYFGLLRPDNISEVILLEAFLAQMINWANGTDINIDAILREIVPSPEARQLHAFSPQDFRDHVRGSVPHRVVEISRFDDAAQRLGLGWHGLPRPGGTVRGIEECTKVLNAITAAAEELFCAQLRQFERRALICRVIDNHEASIVDKSRWERTSGALLALSANPKQTHEEIFERISKANATGYASRVILEAALCECPVGTGFEIADFDLSNLMALAMMIHHLGGYSDAIRYEGMRPEVRISPAGEVQIDVSFFDAIVTPVGESFVSGQINRNRRDYAKLLNVPELVTHELAASRIETRFAEAWQAEMGVSLSDFRIALEALEDRLYMTGQAWEIWSRPALLKYLSQHAASGEQFVSSLELLPRDGWKNIPYPYSDQDRQPWRFRRRLSVARRLILKLDSPAESDVIIIPGMIRDAFRILVSNFYHGQYDLSALRSREMRDWREHIVATEAADFEERVVKRLQELGWQAKRGETFSRILGRKLTSDPGDIDVLAWRPDGRVMLLECKDLQFAKTSSEIAKQLYKFRGETDAKGRPDLLLKHLNRIELARQNACAFQSHLKLDDVQIEGALIFARTVPMTFAAERIGHAVKLLDYDSLGLLCE